MAIKKYAKYITPYEVQFPPKNLGNMFNYNINYTQLEKDGYKMLVELSIPGSENDYTAYYEDQPNQIVKKWKRKEKEPSIDDFINAYALVNSDNDADKAKGSAILNKLISSRRTQVRQ